MVITYLSIETTPYMTTGDPPWFKKPDGGKRDYGVLWSFLWKTSRGRFGQNDEIVSSTYCCWMGGTVRKEPTKKWEKDIMYWLWKTGCFILFRYGDLGMVLPGIMIWRWFGGGDLGIFTLMWGFQQQKVVMLDSQEWGFGALNAVHWIRWPNMSQW